MISDVLSDAIDEIHEYQLDKYPFKHRLLYEGWSAVALESLLKLPDSFFLPENCDDDAD